jgi:Domain of Unknown Function (DUF349)
MKLLSRFFSTTPLATPTLPERIAYLNAGSAEEVGRCAEEILKLADGDLLRGLAGISSTLEITLHEPAALKRAAQARLAQLIDEGAIDFTMFRGQSAAQPAVLAVAALCKDSSRLSQALESVTDPGEIARLATESPSSRVRLMAAELIADPAQLKQVLQQVRNKDKSVYKILKQKSDALLLEQRKAEAIKNEIAEACASLEQLSHRSYDSFYQAAFEGLKTRWRSLSAADADIGQRADEAIERCREVIGAHLKKLSEEAAERAALEAAHALHERERQAAQAAAAAQAEEDAAAKAREREEAAAVREAEEAQRAQQRAAEGEVHRQIGALIRMAQAAIRDGGTQRAAGMRKAIEEKLPAGVALPAQLTRQIQQLDEKLNELRQWKDFAAAPKRLELIAEMQALIGSSEEPTALADRIKSLQQDWQTVSKGIVSEAPEEWLRFQQASQAAYKPCGEYFEAQARLRQQNLEKRRVVFDRLIAFEAAQNVEVPDWQLLESVLREAPRELRQHFPVDRAAGRELQTGFDAALVRLQAKLDAWYERNVADKQSLIKRARNLLTQEDSREAIDAVKRLQLSWKETGPAPAAQSQSLWNEFREVCDSIFQKRQQAYAEYAAGLEANKLKAVALCEEAEAASASSGSALGAVAKIPGWRASFEAIDELPRTEARLLQSRFERAVDLCKAQDAKQRVRDAEQSFADLFRAAAHVRAYERSVIRGADPSERETLKQAADDFISGVPHWPKGALRAMKETLAGADPLSAGGFAAREKALRILCIRSEIRSGLPTPVSDQELRREYQVQRLMQAMGQGMGADDSSREAMALDWIRIGAVPPELHEQLQERFMRSWE